MSARRYDLEALARVVMADKGLQPFFSEDVFKELESINHPATAFSEGKDLRSLPWCSIDNDDSRDLDQLTYASKESDGSFILWVAIADVDALVHKKTAIDNHAWYNTTSVYTPAKIFPMLPEKLSTNLTSLNEEQSRIALVVQMTMDREGSLTETDIYQAEVYNYAKLTYNGVGSWLEDQGSKPQKIKNLPDLEQALLWQHEAAQIIKNRLHEAGSLSLQSPDVQAKVHDSHVVLQLPKQNSAHEMIQYFMIAANMTMARHLKRANIASLRRIVRVPKRWDRIVSIANDYDIRLPKDPDPKALDAFLLSRKKADPESFPDLSLTIIKLLGRGEYVVERPGDETIGHFGLALQDYTHSTAPNRRFPDLISQRQYKALMAGGTSPYSLEELQQLAEHCTEQEDAANKVERSLNKSAAALMLEGSIGKRYQGIITGAGIKGTWVRVFDPPVEGKVVHGYQGLDVGDRVDVKLISIDVYKGYIDFAAL